MHYKSKFCFEFTIRLKLFLLIYNFGIIKSNEWTINCRQSFVQVDIILAVDAPQTISVFSLLNPADVWEVYRAVLGQYEKWNVTMVLTAYGEQVTGTRKTESNYMKEKN